MHGKPAYNDPTSRAYQRRLRSADAYEGVTAIQRFRFLFGIAAGTVLGLFALGRLPDAVGALLGPPLVATGVLVIAWLQRRHVHRYRPPGEKVPPYHPWACRWATAHASTVASWALAFAALTAFVATRSLLAAGVTTTAYAATIAVTWRPHGPLRRWAIAHREPSVLESR